MSAIRAGISAEPQYAAAARPILFDTGQRTECWHNPSFSGGQGKAIDHETFESHNVTGGNKIRAPADTSTQVLFCFHCSLVRRSCAKLHRRLIWLHIPLLHERRGGNGRNRKQGWAEFLSPPRRSKKSVWASLGPLTPYNRASSPNFTGYEKRVL